MYAIVTAAISYWLTLNRGSVRLQPQRVRNKINCTQKESLTELQQTNLPLGPTAAGLLRSGEVRTSTDEPFLAGPPLVPLEGDPLAALLPTGEVKVSVAFRGLG